MSLTFEPSSVNRDPDLLAPKFFRAVNHAIADAKTAGFNLAIFEAWRAPNRQAWLYEQGRSTPGKIVTNAKAWQSWHQYGLAVDIVFLDDKGNYSWAGDFKKISQYFTRYGLSWPLPDTDAGHYEANGGMALAIAQGLCQNAGLQRLWVEACQGILAP